MPWESKASALLAATGDAEFNKDMRNKARKMGMHLNEFGLWRWVSSPGDSGGNEDAREGHWERVPTSTEEDILQELGVEWIEPKRRGFAFLTAKRPRGTPRLIKTPERFMEQYRREGRRGRPRLSLSSHSEVQKSVQ